MEHVMVAWLAWKGSDTDMHGSTLEQYRRHIEKHIAPVLGMVPVTRLDAQMLDHFRADKLQNGRLDGEGGLSSSVVSTLLFVVFSVLRFAQEEGYITDLPRRRTKNGQRRASKDVRVFSRSEQQALENTLCDALMDKQTEGIYMGIFLRFTPVCAWVS